MNYELKLAVETLLSIYDTYGENPNTARIELALFMCYLSASDDIINIKECDAVYYYTGIRATPEELQGFISEYNIRSDEFDRCIPDFVKTLVEADNALISKGVVMERYASQLLFEVYEGIAAEIISVDGDVSVSEELDAIVLLGTIEEYIQNNLRIGAGTNDTFM